MTDKMKNKRKIKKGKKYKESHTNTMRKKVNKYKIKWRENAKWTEKKKKEIKKKRWKKHERNKGECKQWNEIKNNNLNKNWPGKKVKDEKIEDEDDSH